MSALQLRRKALRHAKLHVGNVEQGGNNRGYWVERIIKYAKGNVPEPWCVDFVIWCYGHAGSEIVKPGYTRAVRYMKVPDVEPVDQPHSGNVVRYTFDHTGLFWYACDSLGRRRLWRNATHIKTIEGNTGLDNTQSDGTGDGVHVRVRPKYLVQDYLRVAR